MSQEVECPWCGQKVIPEAKIVKRKAAEVIEKKCPHCSKVMAAYQADMEFLDLIRQRVLTFKD